MILLNLQIPDDLIINVLKRLPAKCLMQFKSVCKAWQALICDPYFAECHHSHAQTRPDASYILFYLLPALQAIIPTNPDVVLSTQLPVQRLQNFEPCTKIVNGLICLRDIYDNTNLRMLNVTTGENIALPRAILHCSSKHVLGFDPVSKKYKLLNFVRVDRDGTRQYCYILTIGTESWRKIDCPDFEFDCAGAAISFNGAIYWSKISISEGASVIQNFDVGDEKFLKLDGPDGATGIDIVTEAGGNLALFCTNFICNDISNNSILWKLTNQGWIKEEINLQSGMTQLYNLHPIGSINTGEIMLMTSPFERFCFNTGLKRLMFYDLGKQKGRWVKLTVPDQPPPSILSDCLFYSANAGSSNHVENIIPLRPQSERRREDISSCERLIFSESTNNWMRFATEEIRFSI